MSTDLEQRLRRDMEQFTQDIRVPPGFAVKACLHRQRRRVTARAVTAVGTAAAVTAGVLTVADVTGVGAQHARTGQVQMDAYVIGRVERAMASPAVGGQVGFSRTVYSPGTYFVFIALTGPRAGFAGASPELPADYQVGWSYHNTAMLSDFTAAGRRVFDYQVTTRPRAVGSVVVIYRNATWWRSTDPPENRGPSRCSLDPSPGGTPVSDWPAAIRDALKCGAFRLDGRQRIDGIDTIKLSASNGAGAETLWVDQATYLPVRYTVRLAGVETTDYRWLPPTPANLAHLRVTIPAGFTQVPPPGS